MILDNYCGRGRELAIIQAASCMNETEISVATYMSLLQGQESEMVELLSQDFEDEWRLKTQWLPHGLFLSTKFRN
jgi:hypothetical protein